MSLRELNLCENRLTSLPAEIGQVTSLEVLRLSDNKLTSVPAEIGKLTSLTGGPLELERAGGDRAAHVAEGVGPRRQSADELAGGDRAARVA